VEIWANRIPLETLYPSEYIDKEYGEGVWEWPDISGRINILGPKVSELVLADYSYCEDF
jgi:hypothetical protein